MNPYRYRGYRYDTETGLYYLQSRYYNPEWGRFINADNVLGQTGQLLSHNLFAYCYNNPVNMVDPDGDIAWWIVGAAVGAIAGGIYSYASSGSIDWRYVAGGALIGAGVGYVGSALMGAGAASAGAGALAKLSQSAINFSVSNMGRLQHAYKHARDLGFSNWNSHTAQQWKCFITSNLLNYTKTFQNTLGNDYVTGYYRYVNGMHIATYIYNSGPYQGLVATVVQLSAQQMQKFGL